MKTLTEKIKDKGVTKRQVAKMVGIDIATLSRILKGSQGFVSVELMTKIHRYLDGLNTDDEGILK